MRALTVKPGVADSARLEERPDPAPAEGALLVRAVALGICGTDREIVEGQYGEAPPGAERLVLGHESLGRVEESPAGSGFAKGDLVAAFVRMPDPEPCPNCAAGEWDMCRNGRYTEHGIKGLDGFGRERWRVDPARAVKVDPALGLLGVLVEPTSVVAKGWEHIEAIGRRARWLPHRVLVTGAGPIGLLAALLGVQRGLEVHVYDHNTDGPKPELVRALGATYHSEDPATLPADFDVVLECTGVASVILESLRHMAADGIACLAGVSQGGKRVPVDMGALNREIVLENQVVFGTVNANRRHYEAAVGALHGADRAWLERLITKRVPLDDWATALAAPKGEVKVVLTFGE